MSRLVSSFALVDLALVVDGEENRRYGDNQEHHCDRRSEDREEVAALDVHVAHEVLFAHRSKDERQQDRAERELILVHQPADDAEDHAHAHVEHVLVDGERAQQGDDQNDRVEHLLFDRDDLREEADAQAADNQHRQVRQHQRRKDLVDGRQLADVHHRARLNALHDEGAQQDGGDGVTRNTEGQQRDHSAAGAAVVRGLGGGNAVRDARAPKLRMLAQALVEAVGNEHGDVAARARNRTDEGADDAAGEDVRPNLLDGLPIRQNVGNLFVRAFLLLFAADDALNARDNLSNREQTDQRRDELEAFQQTRLLIGDEARDAVGRVKTDRAEQHAEERAHKTLGDGLAGDGDDNG